MSHHISRKDDGSIEISVNREASHVLNAIVYPDMGENGTLAQIIGFKATTFVTPMLVEDFVALLNYLGDLVKVVADDPVWWGRPPEK